MPKPLRSLMVVALLTASSCGSDAATEGQATDGAPSDQAAAEPAGTGIRVVSPADGAAILDDPPADLVVLDVRTAEEFGEGHLAGATVLDFYADDFANRLAELDPDLPYLIYCRSGNRSGQTRALMEEFGFGDVADVDGGILAWSAAGLPVEP